MARLKRDLAPKVDGVRDHLEAYFLERVNRYRALKSSPWHHQLAQLRAGERVIVPGYLLREFVDVPRGHSGIYEVHAGGEVKTHQPH